MGLSSFGKNTIVPFFTLLWSVWGKEGSVEWQFKNVPRLKADYSLTHLSGKLQSTEMILINLT